MTFSTHFHRFFILLFSISLFFALTAGQCPPHQKPKTTDEPCQVLVLKNGEHLSIRNVMVLEKSIKYQKCDTLDKVFYQHKKENILSVDSPNGRKLYGQNKPQAKALVAAPVAYKVSVIFGSIAILSLFMMFLGGWIPFIITTLVGGISYLIGNQQKKNHAEKFDAEQARKWRKAAAIINGIIWIPIVILIMLSNMSSPYYFYYW